MTNIPDDIAATAEALVDELHANPDVTFAGILAGPTFERRIAEMLAAERGRCRRVALSYACGLPDPGKEGTAHRLVHDAVVGTATNIAASIEEGDPA